MEGLQAMDELSLVQLLISFVLFFVMFFGIGFLLNMLLRMTWLMAVLYPIVVVLIIDEVVFLDYIFNGAKAWPALVDKIVSLQFFDITVLSGSFIGAIVSGFVMISLRKMGYRMF